MFPPNLTRVTLEGRDWYAEWELLKAFKMKNLHKLRDLLVNEDVTYFHLSKLQREQVIASGLGPFCQSTWRKTYMLVSCAEVDAYFNRNGIIVGGAPPTSHGNRAWDDLETSTNTGEQAQPGDLSSEHNSSLPADDNNFAVKCEPLDDEGCFCPCNRDKAQSAGQEEYQPSTTDVLQPVAKRSRLGPGVKEEKEERRFICESCPFHIEFPTEEVYLRHMKLAHLSALREVTDVADVVGTAQKFICDICRSAFFMLEGLLLHRKWTKHRFQDLITCKHCPMVFSTENDITQHIEKYHIFRGHSEGKRKFWTIRTINKNCLDGKLLRCSSSSWRCIAKGCPKGFTSTEELYKHVQAVHRPLRNCCPGCLKTCSSIVNCKLHIADECVGCHPSVTALEAKLDAINESPLPNARNKFACDLCPRKFSFAALLAFHTRSHAPGKVQARKPSKNKDLEKHFRFYQCSQCSANFTNLKVLYAHRRTHLPFACLPCKKYFKSRKIFRVHMHSHHKDSKTCDLCNRSFPSALALLEHKQSHARLQAAGQNWPIKCEKCETKLVNCQHFQDHMNWHKGQRSYQCNRCGEQFFYKNTFVTHQTRICGAKILTNYCCGYCDKTFQKVYLLLAHVRGKHPREKSTCWHCFEEFKTTSTMFRHVLSSHPQEKSLQPASTASEGFNKNKNKLQHGRKDTAISKSFTCSICGKTLLHACSFKEHMNRHAGIRNYSCERCGKTFFHQGQYAIHRKVPCDPSAPKFKCGFCSEHFSSQRGLFFHITFIHEKNTCWRCSLKFESFGTLLSHVKSQHPDDDCVPVSAEEAAGLEEGQILPASVSSSMAPVALPQPEQVNVKPLATDGNDDGPPPLYLY